MSTQFVRPTVIEDPRLRGMLVAQAERTLDRAEIDLLLARARTVLAVEERKQRLRQRDVPREEDANLYSAVQRARHAESAAGQIRSKAQNALRLAHAGQMEPEGVVIGGTGYGAIGDTGRMYQEMTDWVNRNMAPAKSYELRDARYPEKPKDEEDGAQTAQPSKGAKR